MADIPEESDDEHASSVPYRPHRRDDSDVSTTHLSPPASPSMSPSSLEMSPLSPLRRPFSPPTLAPSSPLYPQSDSDHLGLDDRDHEDIAEDGRDVLVRRLNNLVARLRREHHVKDESIHALHAKVDELENVLYTRDYLSKTGYNDQDGSNLSGEPTHPDNLLPSGMSSLASATRPSPSANARVDDQANSKAKSRASKMTIAQAEQVIVEAQDLHKSLEVVISNLRDRQEETEASSLSCALLPLL